MHRQSVTLWRRAKQLVNATKGKHDVTHEKAKVSDVKTFGASQRQAYAGYDQIDEQRKEFLSVTQISNEKGR